MCPYVIQVLCDQSWAHQGVSFNRSLFIFRIQKSSTNAFNPFYLCLFRITVVLIPLVTVIIYLPSVFRHEVIKCHIESVEEVVYHKKDNDEFLSSLFYSVYKVILEVIFKFVPTVLIAGLNLRIMIVYRKTCERRRRMTLTRNCLKDEDPRKFAEERRLILLLGKLFC